MDELERTPECDPPVGAEERRAARRLAARLATSVLPTCPPGSAEEARVRDFSPFGVGLLMSRRVEYGTRLLIDLERATNGAVHSVLGRVVHATPLADAEGGPWLIGCALVGELDEAGLKAFDAGRVRPAKSDCRAWVRFPCEVETLCHTVEAVPGEHMPARVVNVSAGGVGLLLPCQFESRTLLRLRLPAAPGDEPRAVLVRVRQARPHGGDHWYLGCEFVDRLSDGELAALGG